jgi:5-methylcytosine-specific restriction endonuclease McrA
MSLKEKSGSIEYHREYRAKNRDKIKAKRKIRYEENREQILAEKKRHYEKNKEKVLARVREYQHKNKDKRRDYIRSTGGISTLRWRAKNPDKVAAQKLRHRKKYREKAAAKTRAWRLANPERAAESGRRWRAENLEHRLCSNRKRRAVLRGAVGSHSAADIRSIMKLQRRRCAICREKLGRKHHVDHIVPLALGGTNDRKNLQIACEPCNLSKGARDPIVHMQSLGRLL